MVVAERLEGLDKFPQFVGNSVCFRASPCPGGAGVASSTYLGKENGKVKAGAKYSFCHSYLRNL